MIPLFQYLGGIVDAPHAMLSSYQKYREMILADSASRGYSGQDHMNWLSRHHVLEPVTQVQDKKPKTVTLF